MALALACSSSLQAALLMQPRHSRTCPPSVHGPQNVCGSRVSNRLLLPALPRRKPLVCAADPDPSNEADATSADRSIEDLEARLGVGRKNRRDRGVVGTAKASPPEPKPLPKPRAWDDMSLPEKAWELYIGEKGALFWLNKLAYASIYLIIGGWIVFRFIGPALGWYELDSPLLPPSQVLAGSAGR